MKSSRTFICRVGPSPATSFEIKFPDYAIQRSVVLQHAISAAEEHGSCSESGDPTEGVVVTLVLPQGAWLDFFDAWLQYLQHTKHRVDFDVVGAGALVSVAQVCGSV